MNHCIPSKQGLFAPHQTDEAIASHPGIAMARSAYHCKLQTTALFTYQKAFQREHVDRVACLPNIHGRKEECIDSCLVR
jgi:hypothetical protein